MNFKNKYGHHIDVEKLESLLYGIYFIMICCAYCGSTVFLLLYGKEAMDRIIALEGKRDPCLFRVPYISNENELKKNNYLGDYLEEVDFDYQLEMGDLQYLNNAALKKQCVIYAVS